MIGKNARNVFPKPLRMSSLHCKIYSQSQNLIPQGNLGKVNFNENSVNCRRIQKRSF